MTARLKYFFHARHRKGQGIHSPFMFDFITSVLQDRKWYNAYGIAGNYRKSLLKNRSLIAITDFGAGSRIGHSRRQSVAEIARRSAVNRKFGHLLYRITKHYKPERIIELGTSLGISTYYLAFGHPDAGVITIEADPALAAIVSENLRKQKLTNVHLINNTFDHALPALLPAITACPQPLNIRISFSPGFRMAASLYWMISTGRKICVRHGRRYGSIKKAHLPLIFTGWVLFL
jgi:hypothetical protein